VKDTVIEIREAMKQLKFRTENRRKKLEQMRRRN
jgi:hypothetical protein